ncbi:MULTISPECIES: LysR family transcriptional regulator [Bradyrhizobium]|uniref:LysR family transcriptional regulator n=1 Tax=Bradyrhizobium elkanii TaxID=29448 RepID=UPI0004184094|nr:LysR family transcriptional regulator [Bradyrhizobium elkanii]
MDLLGSLGIFVRVAEVLSFSAVARERDVSQAAVARQISQLEERFGVRLFHRTTRKISLTDDGQMLVVLARPILDGVEDMLTAVGRQSTSPIGLVRVGVTGTAGRFLAQRLPELLADHPGLKVELVVSDRIGDMIEERLDLAMRLGEISDASLIVRHAGTFSRVAVAAPSYIEKHGEPCLPAELAQHTCIVHASNQNSDMWTFVTNEGAQQFRVSGGFLANDASAVHLAARSGYGIAHLALVDVFDDLRSGQLVRVLNNFPSPNIPFSLVYSSRRHLAPRTRAVLNFILQELREIRALLSADPGEGRDQGSDRSTPAFSV